MTIKELPSTSLQEDMKIIDDLTNNKAEEIKPVIVEEAKPVVVEEAKPVTPQASSMDLDSLL